MNDEKTNAKYLRSLAAYALLKSRETEGEKEFFAFMENMENKINELKKIENE